MSAKYASTVAIAVAVGLGLGLGCGSEPANEPPEVRYGEAVCDQCGMILSDERFATATIVEGERGPEPRLFDDFNCQINHEKDETEAVVITRWVHDHDTRAWLPAASAHYARSSKIRTPMASGIAAFADRNDAVRVAREADGEVLAFGDLWAD